jgi:hypothetical protein
MPSTRGQLTNLEPQLTALNDDRQLRELVALRNRLIATKASIGAELAQQQHQLEVMAKKKDAEKARAIVNDKATSGPADNGSAQAQPAPRRTDGSWSTGIVQPQPPDHHRPCHATHAARLAAGQSGRVDTASNRATGPAGPYEHLQALAACLQGVRRLCADLHSLRRRV